MLRSLMRKYSQNIKFRMNFKQLKHTYKKGLEAWTPPPAKLKSHYSAPLIRLNMQPGKWLMSKLSWPNPQYLPHVIDHFVSGVWSMLSYRFPRHCIQSLVFLLQQTAIKFDIKRSVLANTQLKVETQIPTSDGLTQLAEGGGLRFDYSLCCVAICVHFGEHFITLWNDLTNGYSIRVWFQSFRFMSSGHKNIVKTMKHILLCVFSVWLTFWY